MSLRTFGRTVGMSVGKTLGRLFGRLQNSKSLPADVLESEDTYLVVFDAPGAETSDVQVRYDDGRVDVHIDRFRKFREDYELRFPGRGLAFEGSAQLPPDAIPSTEAATATLRDNGTLVVEIPKLSQTDDHNENNPAPGEDIQA